MTGKPGENWNREYRGKLEQGNQERTVTGKPGGNCDREIRRELGQGNQDLPWGSSCCSSPRQDSALRGVNAGSAQGSARCSSSLTSPSGHFQLYLKTGEEQSGLVFLPPEPPALFIWGFCSKSAPSQPDKQDSSS